jgi:hypothetical protein
LRSLLEELDSLQRAQAAAKENPLSTQYIALGRPIDAIVRYLEDEGQPKTEDEIVGERYLNTILFRAPT